MRLAALLMSLAVVCAQEDPISFGILLRGHSGVGFGAFGKLKDDLKASNALGKDFRIVPWATTAGANLDFLFAKRILLSGTLQLQHYDASETERGLARPYALHYGGQLGIALLNKNLWMLYPYLGYQVGTYELRYTNYFTEPIYFGQNQELRPLDNRVYSSSLGLAEVGIGLRRWKRGQGVTLFWGADIGGVFAPSEGKWKASEGPEPQGVSAPKLSGGYLRFSLGFGYIKPKSDEGSPSPIPTAPAAEEKSEQQKPKKEKKRKKIEEAEASGAQPSQEAPAKEEKKGKRKNDKRDDKEVKSSPPAPSDGQSDKPKKDKKKKQDDDED
ncbi:MAG: hypothetical protein NZZ60_06290 [Bacteroidia bacterium]|nr:hypothetical protein [Bacteroidia bacterium]MDW8416322.1 hypothetical protein [Bacteroidia bacterium]